MTVFRDKKTLDIPVTIAERTAQAPAPAVAPKGEPSNELGILVEPTPVDLGKKLNLKEGVGVVIKDIQPDGLGRKLGLQPGDVILQVDDKEIRDMIAFNQAVTEAKKRGLIRLMIQRGAATIYLADTIK